VQAANAPPSDKNLHTLPSQTIKLYISVNKKALQLLGNFIPTQNPSNYTKNISENGSYKKSFKKFVTISRSTS